MVRVIGFRVSNPSPASLKDFIFCWLLLGSFPKFPAADGLRSADPKDSSETGADECLKAFQCRNRGSLCFSSTEQDRFMLKILTLMLMVRSEEAQVLLI